MIYLIKKIALIGIILSALSGNAYSADKGLFGSQEFKSQKINSFQKWQSLRTRHNNEVGILAKQRRSPLKTPCRLSKNFKCVSDEWQEIITQLKNKTPIVKMEGINKHLNKAAYITDMANWRKQDYWATIGQFFKKDGDCEDYAIAKYYSLKELGFSPDQMRIVIVEDTNLNVAHAVLAVYYDNKIWILDNQISRIITENQIVHYKPLYSINENAWWLHKS